MTLVDNYFPFDTGAGAAATPARWRLMARNWCGPGIIPGYHNQCIPTLAGSVVTVDTGAVWIDGFYGENAAPKGISVAGGDGMLVARADPTGRQVIFVYVVGQTVATQSLTDIYEIPIVRMTAGAMTDIRQFASAGPGGVPSGVMLDYGGATAPGGWLLCDGRLYLRTDYPTLFNAIGTSWGGDATHFNVPDCRGRVILGAGSGPGLSARNLGASGGEENHLLAASENGWHWHVNGWTGTEYANTSGAPGWHAHGGIGDYQTGQLPLVYAPGSNQGLVRVASGQMQSAAWGSGTVGTGNQNALHQHPISPEGGNAHNNMQPFVVGMKIIKV